MSTAAAMQHVKAETTKPAQPTSQLATQSRHIESDATQNEFADLRSQATTQRKLQDAAKHSSQNRQFQALQQMTQNTARSIQLKTMSAIMHTPALQRAEDDQALKAKTVASTVQRKTTAAVAEAPKPNNTGLPDNLKSGIESLSGMSMDHVKVHYNSAQPAQLNAHAYAQGSDIHVAPGQEQHLPHEAWHVVQQAQGRVQPTMQMKAGIAVNDDAGLESEADVMGARAKQLVQKSPDVKQQNSYRGISIIQKIRVGHVPTNPGNWRTTTNLAGNNMGVPHADKAFHNGQRDLLYQNNIANQAVAPALAMPPGAPVIAEDIAPNNGLLARPYVNAIEPTIDHIVTRADGGANDYDNARVLSLTNNTPGATAHAGAAARHVRIYEQTTIGATGMPGVAYAPGAILPLLPLQQLATYVGAPVPGAVGAATGAVLTQIVNAGVGNANGITIA